MVHQEKLAKNAERKVLQRDRSLLAIYRTVSQVMSDPDALEMLGLIKAKAAAWAEEDARLSV